eukprot:jgi/Undpi1/10671/HiC_scaffold_29.g13120.m1
MKGIVASMALSATTASLASAFVASPLSLREFAKPAFSSARTCRVQPARMAADADASEEGKVYYASEVTEGNKKTTFTEELGEQPLPEDTAAGESDRFGPVDYKGFIDGEGFDGGDGQVGCVGDGSNAMQDFDNKAVGAVADMKAKLKSSTMVKESKTRQRNAWGSGSSGYAEELKEKGMVKINLQGEDISKIRRQQFENWRNQQEITAKQRAEIAEMDRMTAKAKQDDTSNKWKKGKASYFDEITKVQEEGKDEDWNKYSAPVTSGKKDGTAWEETGLSGNEKIEDTVQCISLNSRPGHTTIEVKNTVMTFEPFHCTFVGDTQGFKVSPEEGTLARRGGTPTELDVSYKGNGPSDNRIGTLVVETEEDKWVYKVEGVVQ